MVTIEDGFVVKRITIENHAEDFLLFREGMAGTVELLHIVVESERGVGRGRELVDKLLANVPPTTTLVYAITRSSNQNARSFYKAIGFRLVGPLIGFYQGRDAVMFGKDVTP